MKKRKLAVLALVSLCLTLTNLNAQEEIMTNGNTAIKSPTSVKNVIKVNPLSPIFRFGSFFYERQIASDISLEVGFLLGAGQNELFFSTNGNDFHGYKWERKGYTAALRFYPSKHAVTGFYLSPFVRYQQANRTFNYEGTYTDVNGIDRLGTVGVKSTTDVLGGGLVAGYQWLFGERITLDLFAGTRFYNKEDHVEYDSNVKEIEGSHGWAETRGGFGLRGGVTLGFAF